jgi:cytochrome c oxidase subunit 2
MNYFYIWGFSNPATPVMEGIIDLHNYIFFFLVIVVIFVMVMLINIIYFFFYKINYEYHWDLLSYRYSIFKINKVTHGTILEIVWIITPSLILIAIAIPSFALLYAMDEIVKPAIIIKAIGHQWYWSYEYSDFSYVYKIKNTLKKVKFFGPKFDSYMIPESDLKVGQIRLLETDNIIVVPTKVHIRMLITGADVLHSWAVPSLGIKVDAVPGRLSQSNLYIKREGSYYGQCSEICGVNHGFMPINVKGTSIDNFFKILKPEVKKIENLIT